MDHDLVESEKGPREYYEEKRDGHGGRNSYPGEPSQVNEGSDFGPRWLRGVV